eukprot:gene9748-11959_t
MAGIPVVLALLLMMVVGMLTAALWNWTIEKVAYRPLRNSPRLAPLITAIGVDYAILMREAVGGAAVSLLGTLLSGMTSWLSFGLLLLSQTPAIANFGLAISLGRTSPWQGGAGVSVMLFWIGLLVLFALATWGGRKLGLIPIVSQLLLASFGLPLVMLWLGAPVGLDNAQVLAAPWLQSLYGVAFTLLLGHILSDVIDLRLQASSVKI